MSPVRCVEIVAPCKVNLTLDITGRNAAGYHLMEMIMQTADLQDRVTLTRVRGSGLLLRSNWDWLPTCEENIASRAVRAFFAATGEPPVGLDIFLDKRIPAQAGLAGGSADGAAVLVGLNALLGTGLSLEQLRGIGVTVGADIPFCLTGGTALVTGIGEKIRPLAPLTGCTFVLAKPAQGMSTKEAFERYDALSDITGRPDTAAAKAALEAGDLAALGAAMANTLEAVVELPGITALKKTMLKMGALGAVMTGSGTAVAGLFADEEAAAAYARALKDAVPFACTARPVDRGAAVVHTSCDLLPD